MLQRIISSGFGKNVITDNLFVHSVLFDKYLPFTRLYETVHSSLLLTVIFIHLTIADNSAFELIYSVIITFGYTTNFQSRIRTS